MVPVKDVEIQLQFRPVGGPGTVVFPSQLRVGNQSTQSVVDDLQLAIGSPGHLGRDGSLDHLAQQVPFPVNRHQRAAVHLGLDLGHPPLHIEPPVELVPERGRVGHMRGQFRVGGLPVHPVSNEPREPFVESVFESGIWRVGAAVNGAASCRPP